MNLTRGLAILVGASVSILPALAQERRIEACEFVKPGMISPMEEAACTYDADGARQRMEHAYAQSLRRARRSELAALGRQAVRVFRDERRGRRRRRRGLELIERVQPGRQADDTALRVSIGVRRRVPRIERDRVEGVRGVDVRLSEERLAERIVVVAGCTILAPLEWLRGHRDR